MLLLLLCGIAPPWPLYFLAAPRLQKSSSVSETNARAVCCIFGRHFCSKIVWEANQKQPVLILPCWRDTLAKMYIHRLGCSIARPATVANSGLGCGRSHSNQFAYLVREPSYFLKTSVFIFISKRFLDRWRVYLCMRHHVCTCNGNELILNLVSYRSVRRRRRGVAFTNCVRTMTGKDRAICA